jgi:signal transduction histidine kinase
VAVDRTAFVQVLVNLAANAAAAMDGRGRLTITLDEAVSDPDRPSTRLRVADTGCGMTRATLDRIFEPFFTTKPIGQGTGLGLYAVYGLIEQMGGTIVFESEPGRGTNATITLPGVRGDLR